MGQKPAKITKQWADGPFKIMETPRKRLGIRDLKKEPGAISNATQMALIHNVFIRILNCIYLQAPNVKLDQNISDFADFMHSFNVTLHEHHGNEENFFFGWLEEYIGIPGFMEKNVEQHHAFNAGLEGFEKYVKALREKKEPYDGAKVRSLVDAFAPALMTHLKDEVQAFEDLQQFEDKINWKEWSAKVDKIAVNSADTEFEVPVIMTNFDVPFEREYHSAVWPPLPWFVAMMFRWL